MPGKNALLQLSRKVHLYFGLFISPALLFFAITGAYQTLGLHEPSSNYKPPALLAELAQIHKKQTNVLPVRREGARPDTPSSAGPRDAARQNPPLSSNPDPGAQLNPGAHLDPGAHPGGNHHDRGSDPGAPAPVGALSAVSSGVSSAAPNGASAPPTGAGPGGARPPQTLQTKQKQHLPLKLFFVTVSLGLLINTLTGIYMSYKYDRNKVLVTGLLVAGVVIPLLLLRF